MPADKFIGKFRFRRDSAANWTTHNPVLDDGEMGVELGANRKFKIGDGTTAWNSLPYGFNSLASGVENEVGSKVFLTSPTVQGVIDQTEAALLLFDSVFQNTWLAAVYETDGGDFVLADGSDEFYPHRYLRVMETTAYNYPLSNALPVGASITFVQANTGQLTLTLGTGITTLNYPSGYLPKTRTRWSTISAIHVGSGAYDISGDLAEDV